MLNTSHVKNLPVIDETALPFNERLFLPQIVHCRLLVAGLHSRYGSSGGCQSWSYRLHCVPGACRGLEQLPHCALSTESRNPQRATIGVDERRAASKGARSQDMVFIAVGAYGNAIVHRRLISRSTMDAICSEFNDAPMSWYQPWAACKSFFTRLAVSEGMPQATPGPRAPRL
jgi:hypothetical protein